MKRLIWIVAIALTSMTLFACDSLDTTSTTSINQTTTESGLIEGEIYQKLIDAEELSGMKNYEGDLISESMDLELPFEYNGVTISYSSRNPQIISNQGIVTLPDSCWIESREQDGVTPVPNLNDNWPVVIDVLMEYMGQSRTAKLVFVVAPEEGFTCDKYLG